MFIDTSILIILAGLMLYILYKLNDNINTHKTSVAALTKQLNEKISTIESVERENHQTKIEINRLVYEKFESFKQHELSVIKTKIEHDIKAQKELEFQKWIIDKTKIIREEASKKSQAVTLGKVIEHLIPLFKNFPFNPQDLKFMGMPIDYIVFDGMSLNKDILDIYFIEVKSGNSALSTIQKKIRDAVKDRRVHWIEFRDDELLNKQWLIEYKLKQNIYEYNTLPKKHERSEQNIVNLNTKSVNKSIIISASDTSNLNPIKIKEKRSILNINNVKKKSKKSNIELQSNIVIHKNIDKDGFILFKSKSIYGISYQNDIQTLFVKLKNNSIFKYSDVGSSKYNDFLECIDKEKYYYAVICKKYKAIRI